jgi:hypothetical protein
LGFATAAGAQPASGSFPAEGAAPPPAPAPTPAPAATPAPPAAPPAAAAPAAAAPAAAAEPPLAAPPPAAPPPPPPATEPPPPPKQPDDNRPIRAQRRFAIGGELGWNGLAGLGANFSFHPIPQLALDTGLGLSLAGLKVGLRGRYNILESEWTPVLGAGLTYALGSGGQAIETQSGNDKVKLEVLGSPYLQLVGGVNYTGSEGFVFMATAGYAVLLNENNTRYESGSTKAFDDVTALVDGGVVVSVAFGYAF